MRIQVEIIVVKMARLGAQETFFIIQSRDELHLLHVKNMHFTFSHNQKILFVVWISHSLAYLVKPVRLT